MEAKLWPLVRQTKLSSSNDSLTGQYLSGARQILRPGDVNQYSIKVQSAY